MPAHGLRSLTRQKRKTTMHKRMEFLPTFYDHQDTVAQLRASHNRCINGLDGCSMDASKRERCLAACRRLFKTYMIDDQRVLQRLQQQATQAINAPDTERIARLSALSKQLNLHNRQLCRLTQLFLLDICDYHPSDQTTVNSNVIEGTKIDCNVFLKKVESLVAELEKEGTEGSLVRVPTYEIV